MAREENDDDTLAAVQTDIASLEKDVSTLEFRRMFNNPADPNNCFIDIQAGAGGTEACDWASMLLRQYLKYAERKGFKAELQVDSGNVAGKVAWTPVLEIAGTRHPIVKARTVIGRGSDADITVDDSGTSRRHVEILWDGSRAQVHDLDSTNGSQLNGEPVKQAVLEPDSVVTIGRTRIIFRVVAQAAPAGTAGDSTQRHDQGGFWGTTK